MSVKQITAEGIYHQNARFWGWILEELRKRYAMRDGSQLTVTAAARMLGLMPGYVGRMLRGMYHTRPTVYLLLRFHELCPDIPWDVIMQRLIETYGDSAAFKQAASPETAVVAKPLTQEGAS